MKQIKTIVSTIDNHETFDKEVNDAIAGGWTLVKREVINPNNQPHFDTYFNIALYAELEREIERDCENCKHHGKGCDDEPCAHCDAFKNFDKWEASEE